MSVKFHPKERFEILMFILPSILGMLVFFGVPFIWMVVLSFDVMTPSGKTIGFENYTGLFQNSSFNLAVMNTLKFTIISVPLIMVLALLLAIMLNKKIRFKRQLRTSFVVPLVVPTASIILFFEMIFDTKGLVNGLLQGLGAESINWMSSDYAIIVLVTIYVWKNIGYNMILFWSGLQNIPIEYYEAASIDGASKIQQFIYITFIYLVPTSFFVLVISIMNSFKVFKEVYILAGAYPHQSIYLLQHFMNNLFSKLDYNKLVAAAILMMGVITLIVLIMFKVQNKLNDVMGQ